MYETCFALIEMCDYDCGSGLVHVDAGVDGNGEFVQICCSSPRETISFAFRRWSEARSACSE